MKKKILLISLGFIIILTGCSNKEKENTEVSKTNGMLSYTIDGESANEQPTKESGYIVNKILCDKDLDLMWDNDNWEVEFTNISSGKCTIDFTKDTNTQGYRITVTSNNPSSLDSLSKSTVENGTVKIYSKSKIESVTGCNATIEDNIVIVRNITENQICNITVEDKTLAGILKIAYPPQVGRTDFSVIDNGTPGLYTAEDDQGTTYYFSGDGSQMNNWVSYAGKYWRVIRINGNESVRMLYAGDGSSANDIGSSRFNSTSNHPGYVGWKYTLGGSLSADRGNGTKSTIYGVVESWYNNLGSTNQNYLDTAAIYCNDRELRSGDSYSTSSTFYYAVYGRLESNGTPTFKCSNSSDRFTGSNSIPVGLMTADEVVAAGGVFGTNSPKTYYYLAKDGSSSITGSNWWWTMSPSNFYWGGSNIYFAFMFSVRGSSDPGYLARFSIYGTHVVRPVVSLKTEVIVTGGDGSAGSPYTVTLH